MRTHLAARVDQVLTMPRRIRARPVLLSLSLAVGAASVGCGGTVTTEPTVSASSAATRGPVARGAHGFVKLAGEALGDVPLAPSQRADIEELAAGAEAGQAAARAARKELMLTVAAQVQSGSIDRAALQPEVDGLVAALRAARPGERAAFERLHAILTPDQRVAFVDALEARGRDRIGQARAKGPWKSWADDLNLSAEQRAQMKTVFEQKREGARSTGVGHGGRGGAPWAEARQRRAAIVEAFKQDRFVLDEVAPAEDVGQQVGRMSEHILGMAEAVVPLLTPEQRAIAAQRLRTQADEGDALAPPGP